jgi:hypothetical protein
VARIFISHSSNDDAFAAEVRDAVVAKLSKHTPLVDTNLKAGDRWRAKLLRWLGACHGAVLLLTDHAMDRDWVRTEAAIIGWRAWLNPAMKVVTVLLDEGASSSALDKLGLGPVRLRDIQVLKADDVGRSAAEIATEVANRFAEFAPRSDEDDPIAEWVKQAGTYLERNAFLEETASVLDIADEDRDDRLFELVAHRLLHSDYKTIEAAVLKLKNDAKLSPGYVAFVGLVNCAWLPADMAAPLSRVTRSESAPRVAAVCVASETTAVRLLKRLTCCDNRYVVVGQISSDGTGADERAELRSRYERAILRAVGVQKKAHYAIAIESLREGRGDRPVFVILGEDALRAGVLDDLAADFGESVFLCAADRDVLSSSVLAANTPTPAIELTPALEAKNELKGSSMADRLENAA